MVNAQKSTAVQSDEADRIRELSRACAGLVADAEKGGLMPRDGRLLKQVPKSTRLSEDEIQARLYDTFLEDGITSSIAREWWGPSNSCSPNELAISSKTPAGAPKRTFSGWLRGLAYFSAGLPSQSLKDARFALAYLPNFQSPANRPHSHAPPAQAPDQTRLISLAPSTQPTGNFVRSDPTDKGPNSRRILAACLSLMALSYETLGETTEAAINMWKAVAADRCPAHVTHLKRISSRLETKQQQALQHGGRVALEKLCIEEHENSLPEFMRTRPKYYYYRQWMTERIAQQLGIEAIVHGGCRPVGDDAMEQGRQTTSCSALEMPHISAERFLPDGASLVHRQISHQPCADDSELECDLAATGVSSAAPCVPPLDSLLAPVLQESQTTEHANNWGGNHVTEACFALVDKLLGMDADDLELLLTYPAALRGQVLEMIVCIKDHGVKGFSQHYQPPRLEWAETQALVGPGGRDFSTWRESEMGLSPPGASPAHPSGLGSQDTNGVSKLHQRSQLLLQITALPFAHGIASLNTRPNAWKESLENDSHSSGAMLLPPMHEEAVPSQVTVPGGCLRVGSIRKDFILLSARKADHVMSSAAKHVQEGARGPFLYQPISNSLAPAEMPAAEGLLEYGDLGALD